MADDAQSGPGDVPGVDTLAFLANGFFPTHSPRPDSTFAPAVHSAVDRCCDATARDDIAAHAGPDAGRDRAGQDSGRLAHRGGTARDREHLPRGPAEDGPAEDHADLPRGQPEVRLRLPELRVALAGRQAAPVRVLRERRQGHGRRGHEPGHRGRVLRRVVDRRAGRPVRPLAQRAGPAGRADAPARGLCPLRADLLGRGVRPHRPRAPPARVAGRRGVLHLGPGQQRGRVPVPALRSAVRDQQSARLLEHVP